MFRSGHSVLFCFSVYSLCVDVYCTILMPPDVTLIAVNRYITLYHILSTDVQKPVNELPLQPPL